MGQPLKVIHFENEETNDEKLHSEQITGSFTSFLLPVKISAILTAILGVISLVLEVQTYFQYRYEIYLARLIPTIISFVLLILLNSKIIKKNSTPIIHIYLISIIASLCFVGSKIHTLLNYNLLSASIFVLITSIYFKWNKINKFIVPTYAAIFVITALILTGSSLSEHANLIISLLAVLISSVLIGTKGEKVSEVNIPVVDERQLNDDFDGIYTKFFHDSLIPLFRAKINGELIESNKPFKEIIETNDEEVKQNLFNDIINNPKVVQHLKTKLENKKRVENYRFSFKSKEAKDKIFSLDCRTKLIDDQVFIEGSLKDITDEYKKNKALQHEIETLRKSKKNIPKVIPNLEYSDKKSNLISKMGHQLRTPMNSVLGFLTLIENGLFENENELKEFSHSAKLSAEALLGLLNDVVEISKIQEGLVEVSKEHVNLRTEINNLAELFKPHLEQKNLKLEINIGNDLPEQITLDKQKYLQIIINIIRIAIEFSEDDTIKLGIKLRNENKESTKLVTVVEDAGIPLSNDKIVELMNYNIDNSESNSKINSNLLHIMIAKELANIIDAELQISSEENSGNCYEVITDLEIALEKQKVNGLEENKKQISAQSHRLLLVEDNPISRKVEQKLLQEAGYDVTSVDCAADAIINVEQGAFDLVLMDIELKDMNGLEATKLIRQLPEPVNSVPIIAVTAHSSMKDREKCLIAGMNDYISKPINITFLKMTIDQWLQYAKKK